MLAGNYLRGGGSNGKWNRMAGMVKSGESCDKTIRRWSKDQLYAICLYVKKKKTRID